MKKVWSTNSQKSNIAKTATEISGDELNTDESLEGTLVAADGKLTIAETLGDEYLLAGDYVTLSRTVEMYAWVEETESETVTKTGGSEETTTTYEYAKDWVSSPGDSSDFRYPDDHFNPTKKLESESQTVTAAKVGVYNIDPAKASLPAGTKLTLNEDNVLADLDEEYVDDEDWFELYDVEPTAKLASNYLYISVGSAEAPQVGDLRISYSALKPGMTVTAFGKLDGSYLVTYVDEDGNDLFRVYQGTKDEAVAAMHSEHVTTTWILRAVGFLMMMIGLSSMLGPISTILDVLPFLGKMSRSLVGLVSAIVSVVLTVLTILISMVIHNLVALIITVVVIAGIVVLIVMMKKGKKGGEPKSPEPVEKP